MGLNDSPAVDSICGTIFSAFSVVVIINVDTKYESLLGANLAGDAGGHCCATIASDREASERVCNMTSSGFGFDSVS